MRDRGNERRWRDEAAERDSPGDEQPDRGRMYEQSTAMGGYGQQGWQGGYSQPGPGQVGQQQDYRQQQRWGQGAASDDRPDGLEGQGFGQSWGQGRGMGRGLGPERGFGPERGLGPERGAGPERGLGRAEGRFRGRGPKGYVRSDERLREDVGDRLSEDSWVDASDIEVTVADGIVTLDGTIADRDQKRRAEDVAADVLGVHDVVNRLRVRHEGENVLDRIGTALTGSVDRPSER